MDKRSGKRRPVLGELHRFLLSPYLLHVEPERRDIDLEIGRGALEYDRQRVIIDTTRQAAGTFDVHLSRFGDC